MQNATYAPSRRRMLGLAGAALILPRTAFAAPLATLSGRAFGTAWRLIAPAGTDLASLGPAIETLFAGIDQRFSPWRPDSTLARFNAMRSGQPLADADLAHVTAAALTIAERSGGAFDPSVGPLVAQWGFGPIREGGAPDWRGLQAADGTIGKTRDDLTLDLCGIAKGWALDRATDLVEGAGITAFLLEIGGEFTARGRHPDGRDWRLAVDIPPIFTERPPTLRLPDGASVATSGLWEQGYRLGGRLYSHIIDTGAAAPVSGTLRSVTVVAPDAMSADGWATALCAAGADAGPDIAASMGLPALFLLDADGTLGHIETGRIRDLLL